MHTTLETDYLIIGAGAMAMAFADELLRNDPSAELIFVERRARPGGHWNDAYPFVKLHQPAIAYGINSIELSESETDLSNHPQLLAYYEKAMKTFDQTGRVTWLFKSEYKGNGKVCSLMNPERETEIKVRRKIVDSTYMRVEVPSTHPPAYEVAEEVELVAPNALSTIDQAHEKYVVVGGGKTSIDAILFLIANGVEPDRIQWIISNDMWMWAREPIVPGKVGQLLLDQVQALLDSSTINEAYLKLEQQGQIFRLDKDVLPTKWRCATVSMPEYQNLLSIKDIVREGRVKAVQKDTIAFENGHTIELEKNTLVVNCSANGLAARQPKPVFQEGLITLQSVSMCQQVFSACLIGKLETLAIAEERRNAICTPIPHPERVEDLPNCLVQTLENTIAGNKVMPLWFLKSRLNIMAHGPLWNYLVNSYSTLRLMPKVASMIERYETEAMVP